MASTENLGQFCTLVDIIARLRAPNGCPWDKKQTHNLLRENLLAECYEVLECLDEGHSSKLCSELGDLLMQIVLHAQIATENGTFNIEDVIKDINMKLIHRHPHIFGSQKVKDAEEVALHLEVLKQRGRDADTSILGSVPQQMPALAYSHEVQRRVAQIGFDWEDVDDVIDKLVEEVSEFKWAITREQKEWEFGDLLFTLANVARRLEIDLETALREANQRFYRRFTYMEEVCRQRELDFGGLSFAEQNALWEEAKRRLQE